MRFVCAAILLPWLAGCAANPPPGAYARVELPYSACGSMANLRGVLTGGPEPSAKSDALLHRLGVRCVGDGYPAAHPRK